MQLSMHSMSVETFIPMLGNLAAILDRAIAFAQEKKIGPAVLPNARLAADMFPLTRQVQIACDNAVGCAARLADKEPLKFEDNETTLEELKSRIAKAIEFLKGIRAEELQGSENRKINFDLIAGLELDTNGLHYLKDWALPHFYFHMVTAYDILRHCGLEIGKRDYLAHVGTHIRQK